jgi:hypothetical protein
LFIVSKWETQMRRDNGSKRQEEGVQQGQQTGYRDGAAAVRECRDIQDSLGERRGDSGFIGKRTLNVPTPWMNALKTLVPEPNGFTRDLFLDIGLDVHGGVDDAAHRLLRSWRTALRVTSTVFCGLGNNLAVGDASVVGLKLVRHGWRPG